MMPRAVEDIAEADLRELAKWFRSKGHERRRLLHRYKVGRKKTEALAARKKVTYTHSCRIKMKADNMCDLATLYCVSSAVGLTQLRTVLRFLVTLFEEAFSWRLRWLRKIERASLRLNAAIGRSLSLTFRSEDYARRNM